MSLIESRLALRLYARLPAPLQLRVKRALAPSYTLGAVVALRRADGDVLLVCQSYRPGWALPGGLVDRHEQPRHAAARELHEELGVDLAITAEPTVVVAVDSQEVDCVFVVDLGDRQVAAVPRSPEIARVGWFAPDALPDMQPEARRALVAAGVAPR